MDPHAALQVAVRVRSQLDARRRQSCLNERPDDDVIQRLDNDLVCADDVVLDHDDPAAAFNHDVTGPDSHIAQHRRSADRQLTAAAARRTHRRSARDSQLLLRRQRNVAAIGRAVAAAHRTRERDVRAVRLIEGHVAAYGCQTRHFNRSGRCIRQVNGTSRRICRDRRRVQLERGQRANSSRRIEIDRRRYDVRATRCGTRFDRASHRGQRRRRAACQTPDRQILTGLDRDAAGAGCDRRVCVHRHRFGRPQNDVAAGTCDVAQDLQTASARLRQRERPARRRQTSHLKGRTALIADIHRRAAAVFHPQAAHRRVQVSVVGQAPGPDARRCTQHGFGSRDVGRLADRHLPDAATAVCRAKGPVVGRDRHHAACRQLTDANVFGGAQRDRP